jgi:ABC-type glycerol-3-phosphate transport system substrate-binding protein
MTEGSFLRRSIALLVVMFGLAACGQDPGTRALTGGAIGAGAGAVVGSTTVVGAVPGAVIGGLGGAVVGAVTTPLSW